MRILQGITSVDANDVIPNLGGLYQYPYSVLLRQDDNTVTGIVVEQYTPFVVLEFITKVSGKYVKILSSTGEIGIVVYNPRYLRQLFIK